METELDPALLERLRTLRLPRHVAIIMDGNGRWAQRRGRPRHAGHRAGVPAVRETVEAAARLELEALTLFAFSSENWQRPRAEVRVLMELLRTTLDRELERLHDNGIRLRIIGDRNRLERSLRRRLAAAEELTEGNKGLTLVVATSYGGRWEIAETARRLASRVQRGELAVESITEEAFAEHLATPEVPDPDLFIRTGGERRISNFLIWQLAYTELVFSDTLWPDFGLKDFAAALEEFAGRDRRFGRIGDQVKQIQHA